MRPLCAILLCHTGQLMSDEGCWIAQGHGSTPVTERYLASWLAVHCRPDGRPQTEYARRIAAQMVDLRAYVSSFTQPPPCEAIDDVCDEDNDEYGW